MCRSENGDSEVNIGEAVEQKEKVCDEVGTVREFTYLSDFFHGQNGLYIRVI